MVGTSIDMVKFPIDMVKYPPFFFVVRNFV